MTAPQVGLVAAARDDRLLGVRPHPRQVELLQAIEDNRMVVAAAGRRGGKTRCAAAGAIHNLLLCPELDAMVAPGEKRYAVSIANNQAQARIFLDHAHALVKASSTLRGEVESVTANQIEFRGGRVLAAFPCTARGARGWPISYLCRDEFGHFLDVEDGGPAVAERIYAALAPSVAQFGPLGRVVIVSTPLAADGLFAELHQRARNGEIPGAVAFLATTGDMNPAIHEEFLRAQEVALGPDDFRREYLAEFLSGGAAFIENEKLRDAVEDYRELMPLDGRGWVCGLDPGFASDPFALTVVREGYP